MHAWKYGFLSPPSPPGAPYGLGGHPQVILLLELPGPYLDLALEPSVAGKGQPCARQNTRVSLWPSSATDLLCDLRLFTFVHNFVFNSQNPWPAFCLTPSVSQGTCLSWQCDPVPLTSTSGAEAGGQGLQFGSCSATGTFSELWKLCEPLLPRLKWTFILSTMQENCKAGAV